MNDKAKRSRWWVIFLLFCGTCINMIDRGSLGVAAPYIMKDLNLDPALMGVVLSSFFWSYLIMQIPSGAIADKFGGKTTLGWAAFIWSFLSGLTGLTMNYFQLILCRIGVGVGEAAIQPTNVKVVKDNFPSQERGTAVGIFNSGMRLGLAIVPILMAFLIHTFNWRWAFFVTGGGSLLWVALWYFTYRDPVVDKTQTGSGEKIPWLKLLRHRTVIGIVLCKFFQDYLYYMFVTWLPAYLVMDRGFTIMKMGWYASLPWVFTFLALPMVGLLSDVLIRRGMSVTKSRKGIIIIGQFIAASIIFAVYTDNALIAVSVFTVALVTESSASTLLWAVCADIAPPNASGAVAGIMNSAGALAGTIAPIVTGILLKMTGNFQQAFVIASGMIALAALSMWFIVGKIEPIRFNEGATNSLTE